MIYLLSSLCENKAGYQVFGFLGSILTIIKIIVPIVIVIMGSIDLVKAIVAGKEDELKRGYSTLIKRIIVGVVIFFVPGIVGLIINLAGATQECKSAECVFDNSSECVKNAEKLSIEEKLGKECAAGEIRYAGICINPDDIYR